ncbi:hypothetical protein AB4072_01260 [Microvirga sp. 2MCAF38]
MGFVFHEIVGHAAAHTLLDDSTDDFRNIIDTHRLDLLLTIEKRHHQRKRCEASQERRPAIGIRSDNQTGAQNRPGQIGGHQDRIG